MIGLYILLGLIGSVAGMFFWTYMHELSHLIMWKRYFTIVQSTIIPYPHFDDGKFYFGRLRKYVKGYQPKITSKQLALISVAPRFVDLAGIILLSVLLIFFTPGLITVPIFFFLFGSVVDLITGSIGYND